ncbi:FAD-dependent oxidoreductase [Agromyces sp. SYSU T00194]|uniref:FAD-dependent oxidoreductase n=1 Tax=Agromyces chitinivorans TaxID=3158560 RepID=UPI003397311F
MTRRRIAILGAGIMGGALAIELARRGQDVTVLDRAEAPMSSASRWNEGKIHLGYLYGADPTLATARHVLPGGLAFGPLVRDLVGTDLDGHVTRADDVYLVHRHSVCGPDELGARFAAIDELVRAHPDAGRYLVDVTAARSRALGAAELSAIAGPEVVAGFRVPERSVETRWLADRLAAAVAAEPGVTVHGGVEIVGAEPVGDVDGRWRVRAVAGAASVDLGPFDAVVNALWGGRLPVDVAAGVAPEPPWTHRIRLSAFVRTRGEHQTPSAVVSIGPFGDVKNYDGRNFYLSWYPVGLVAQGDGLELAEPAPPTGGAADAFVARVRAGLEPVLPGIGAVFDDIEDAVVAGGPVFARGAGALDDPRSGLHRRDRFGVARRGSYHSVDTGKYSTAPWLARRLAIEITERD